MKINVTKHLRSLHKCKSIYLGALKGTSLLHRGTLVTCSFVRQQKYKYEKKNSDRMEFSNIQYSLKNVLSVNYDYKKRSLMVTFRMTKACKYYITDKVEFV